MVIADAQSPDYFETLENLRDIKTVFYEDSVSSIAHYLRNEYYDYMSNDCRLLEKNSKSGNFLGRKTYGSGCRESFKETWCGHTLADVALDVGLPVLEGIPFKRDGQRIVTFIHIIQDAVSFRDGDVYFGRVKIIPQRCKRNLAKSCPKPLTGIPRYKAVFTITQYWGNGFYHSTLEDLPRISPYLGFLRQNRHIRIHVPAKMIYFSLLGIDNSRLITEPVIHADILYMPAGGPCGNSPVFTTQVLAGVLTGAIDESHSDSTEADTIVLIKRSKRRWFADHDGILRMLRARASEFKLRVDVFADNPLPGIDKTINIFNRALVVIAPHGAGEANLIFSQPGTLLIEGLCYDYENKTNLCYRNMAQTLGLRYYGLIYPYQCMNITVEQIERALLEYLKQMFQ
ncbi:hypothetical protein LSH36_431g00015 [Paralvinella palmiformis]|uniref:Glycosyltransferase 61 catalytic domain-containing protein n=1 Tax=Paralvinella palmiformis TaxID=53620 RepID=A0AAD9MXY7_9ANNE|nr:hypothetical protein LSH36_431g00015 [Paralvinella palmiformis]